MSGQATYKALKACVAGGVFRRPGETFQLPEMETAPPHLKRLAAEDMPAEKPAAERRKRAAVTAENGVTAEDIGGGKVKKSEDLTSKDMISK